MSLIPRGARNNNPGNIRFNKHNKWIGQTGQDDKGFAIFSDMSYGVRAASKLLDTYYNKHGLRSIRAMISRYAPSHENPTDAYVLNVSLAVGITPDEPMAYTIYKEIKPKMLVAMFKQELGTDDIALVDVKKWQNIA